MQGAAVRNSEQRTRTRGVGTDRQHHCELAPIGSISDWPVPRSSPLPPLWLALACSGHLPVACLPSDCAERLLLLPLLLPPPRYPAVAVPRFRGEGTQEVDTPLRRDGRRRDMPPFPAPQARRSAVTGSSGGRRRALHMFCFCRRREGGSSGRRGLQH
jgi:hypothetical protein